MMIFSFYFLTLFDINVNILLKYSLKRLMVFAQTVRGLLALFFYFFQTSSVYTCEKKQDNYRYFKYFIV